MRILLTGIGKQILKNLNEDLHLDHSRSKSMLSPHQIQNSPNKSRNHRNHLIKSSLKNKILDMEKSHSKSPKSPNRSNSSKNDRMNEKMKNLSPRSPMTGITSGMSRSRIPSAYTHMPHNREIELKVKRLNIPFNIIQKYSDERTSKNDEGSDGGSKSFLPTIPKNIKNTERED